MHVYQIFISDLFSQFFLLSSYLPSSEKKLKMRPTKWMCHSNIYEIFNRTENSETEKHKLPSKN